MLRYITCIVPRRCWFLAQRKDQHGEHKAPTGEETRHFVRTYHVTFVQYREINDGEIAGKVVVSLLYLGDLKLHSNFVILKLPRDNSV